MIVAKLGVSSEDLVAGAADNRPQVLSRPFLSFVPQVAEAVTSDTSRAHKSYWNRIVKHRASGQ
ncbi:hypothetical protein AB0K00_33190 [Dactylosporangium sp. NPDC049525]|uniref:hypothetical protein n=1 Tax=Dactylosporangium sp. NPDC049525 TaxID=3154730 RepID=UPI00342E8BB8